MEKYKHIKSEHQLRSLVFDDYFKSKGISWEQEIDKIDFIITEKQSRKGKEGGSEKHYLWAETKKSGTEQYIMLTQLLLTIKKPYDKNEYHIPNYVSCFDTEKIIFVPTKLLLPILKDNDIKWNITPSDIKDEYFLKIISKLKYVLFNDINVKIFTFGTHDEEIKNFIKNNILKGDIENKFRITDGNFDRVYLKWVEKVKPSIAVKWDEEKKIGLLDADFYLADLLSKDDYSIKEKLLIVLQNDHYKLIKALKKSKLFKEEDEYTFRDKQKAHKEFWSIYERPPLPEFWDNIINRKDLLVPQDIRERKGSFFTPQIWVEKSQEYIADVFGKNWQDKYYVWDCCAGTGNLLVGINRNIENVFASTIDESDVKAMYDRIENGAKLLKKNVFQFDFLNDDFKKVPKALKEIIDSKVKRKKLLIYINPPYAESSGGEKAKSGVSTLHKTRDNYQAKIGKATNEIFSQFLARIHDEISGCNLGFFSKLKYINGSNFNNFRSFFTASFLKGFICKGNTFDNVNGEFPIGFSIWELTDKKFPHKLQFIIYDEKGNKIGKKSFYNNKPYINKWISSFDVPSENIGKLYYTSNDFQQNKLLFISLMDTTSHLSFTPISKNNFFEISIYFSVRLCMEQTWLNDRDQFLYPNDEWQNDIEFQNDCVIFTLFHGQNRITSDDGINHWIPFTEEEIGIKGKFKSNFMSEFIAGKLDIKKENDFFKDNIKRSGKLKFSKEAKEVYNAGLELWKYYHAQSRINIDASFYDIRGHFQKFSNGKMNNKSDDEEYNTLIGKLREKMKILAKKIEPKVYEYGFLLE
jgi:16S rRNA G966 N2-methylase RsmD